MAIRIRKNNKEIVCAAITKKRVGDCYLDDEIHYRLVTMGVLDTNDGGNNWFFQAHPSGLPARGETEER